MSELPRQTTCFMSELSIEPAIFMSEVLGERRILLKINRYRFPAATRFTISATAFHCTSFLERGHEVFTPKLQFPLIFSTVTFIPNGIIQ